MYGLYKVVGIWVLVAAAVASSSEDASACATGAPDAINLFASYETGTVGATTPVNEFKVHSCSLEDSGKFALVTMGPDLIGLDYSRQISFSGTFQDDSCKP